MGFDVSTEDLVHLLNSHGENLMTEVLLVLQKHVAADAPETGEKALSLKLMS